MIYFLIFNLKFKAKHEKYLIFRRDRGIAFGC